MRIFAALLLSAFSLGATDQDFNGRWNLDVPKNPVHRAWWLEITGAGTSHPAGRFVGFSGGNMDPIPHVEIEGGVLHFHSPEGHQPQDYTAHLEGSRLVGEMHSAAGNLEFSGVRAPQIREGDDGSWKAQSSIELFDGKSLNGWTPLIPDKPLGWTVSDGSLKSAGNGNNLLSTRKFWNFDLHVEYRVADKSNSGVGLRSRYEVQILGDYGEPPNLHGSGALYSRILPSVNASLPPDQWQTMDVRLIGRTVTVTLNGKRVIDRQTVEGATALVMDPNEDQPGPIFLQGDHGAVEFRKVTITPLVKR